VPGRGGALFDCLAAAEITGPTALNAAPLLEATMLIVPIASDEDDRAEAAVEMGASCRICSRQACPGRREPSILSEGF